MFTNLEGHPRLDVRGTEPKSRCKRQTNATVNKYFIVTTHAPSTKLQAATAFKADESWVGTEAYQAGVGHQSSTRQWSGPAEILFKQVSR